MEPNEGYARSVAYHEAAHIVIAAVQGIPLTDRGIYLDRWGNGIAHYLDRKPDGSVNVGASPEREKTIIATAGGWIAQSRIRPCTQSGAYLDIGQINALLTEMYPDGSQSWWAARERLLKEAERLVELHWAVIEAVALALLAKPDIPCEGGWSPESAAKHLSTEEILELLRQAGVSVRIDRRQPSPPPEPKEGSGAAT